MFKHFVITKFYLLLFVQVFLVTIASLAYNEFALYCRITIRIRSRRIPILKPIFAKMWEKIQHT